MQHVVFISYSSKDAGAAEAICTGLEALGIRAWMAPRDIQSGDDWGKSIIEAINHAKLMLVLFTAHSNASRQVLREVERAVAKGLTLVPVRLEEVTPTDSMEYFLSATHWFDLIGRPLAEGVPQLVETVQSALSGTGLGGETGDRIGRLKARAERGELSAQNELGAALLVGEMTARDVAAGVRWLQRAAEQGHAEALFNLGHFYEDSGERLLAYKAYTGAARQEHALARARLETWNTGNATAEEDDAAGAIPAAQTAVATRGGRRRLIYISAAALLLAVAGAALILQQRSSHGVARQDAAEIETLYRQARLGDAVALHGLQDAAATSSAADYALARAFDLGIGGLRDEGLALRGYSVSAEAGSVEAQRELGEMYQRGFGVERDPGRGFLLLQKAAAKGDAEAQYALARSYETGTGTAVDAVKAVHWYKLAARQKLAYAERALQHLSGDGR